MAERPRERPRDGLLKKPKYRGVLDLPDTSRRVSLTNPRSVPMPERGMTNLGAANTALNAATSPLSLLRAIGGGLLGGAQHLGQAVRGEIDLQDPAQTAQTMGHGLNAMSGGLLAPTKGVALGSGPLLKLMGVKEPAPRYYSALAKTVKATKQALTPEQWLKRLRNAKDVKEEEIQWLEVPGLLHDLAGKTGKKSVHPDQLLASIEPRKAVPAETVYGYDQAGKRMDRSPATPEEIAEVERRLVGPAQAPPGGMWDQNNPYATGRQNEPSIQRDLTNALGEAYEPPTGSEGAGGISPMAQIWHQYGYHDIEGPAFYRTPQATSLLSRLETHRPGLLLRPPEMRQEALSEAALALRPQAEELPTQYGNQGRYPVATPPGGTNYREVPLRLENIHKQGPAQRRRAGGNDPHLNQPYHSSHWRQDPNVVFANRYDDREIGGVKTLATQESQADIHQAARWRGYLEPLSDEALSKHAQGIMDTRYPGRYYKKFKDYAADEQGRILKNIKNDYPPVRTDMPLKDQKDWARLSAKQMLREGAEGKYPQVAWTHSSQQVARWQGHDRGFKQHYDDFFKGAAESLTGGKARLVTAGKDTMGRDLKWWVIDLSEKQRQKFLDEGFPLFTRGVPVPGQERDRKARGGLVNAAPPQHGRVLGGGLLGSRP